ncbi:MAG: hypothetical protein UY95_C0018G0009 [Parcubacteria group bacterium GW2011_GWA2_56_7]|nr:MAG: hypothetical protein UY95_C0018G0009 [Parcubacteria group bacterium GW2011_GWA2_56_7]
MKKGLLTGDWFEHATPGLRDDWARRRTADIRALRTTFERRGTQDYTRTHGISRHEVNVEPVDMTPIADAVEKGAEGIRGDLEGIGSELTLVRAGTENLLEHVRGSEKGRFAHKLISDVIGWAIQGGNLYLASRIWKELRLIATEIGLGFVGEQISARVSRDQQVQLHGRLGRELRWGRDQQTDLHQRFREAINAAQEQAHLDAGRIQAELAAAGVEDRRHHRIMEVEACLSRAQSEAVVAFLRERIEQNDVQHRELKRLFRDLTQEMRLGNQTITAAVTAAARTRRRSAAWELYHSAYNGVRVGNFGSAITDLDRALEQKSDFPHAWLLLGNMCLTLGRTTDARNALSLCQRYAECVAEREVEEHAFNQLLSIERLVGNEDAEIELTYRKWERGYRLHGTRESFSVLRARMRHTPAGGPLTSNLRHHLRSQLPKMIRESQNIGRIVATHKDFTLCRPHLGDIERFGSWVYILNDLEAILGFFLLRSENIPSGDPRRALAEIIGPLLKRAPDDFADGQPLPHLRERYNRLFKLRKKIYKTLRGLVARLF